MIKPDITKKEILETKHKHQLKGTVRILSKKIELEVDEIRILLNRDEPNKEMINRRLNDIVGILRDQLTKLA